MPRGDHFRKDNSAAKALAMSQVPQMETVVEKRKKAPANDNDKIWQFQLCFNYPPEAFPVDKKTGKHNTPLFPKHYVVPNQGIAFDPETGRAREWRYIEGQPSIWADEQPLLDSLDEAAISKLLADNRNQLEFYWGQMTVRGIHKLRLQALQVQDIFEGNDHQYLAKNREYRLLNPEKDTIRELDEKDKRFAAEKAARECTMTEVIECAYVMGIDISDQSDLGLKKIRLEFIKKAEYDHKNPKALDWFMGIVGNAATHATYTFAMALEEGVLSASQLQNKLTWGASKQAIMDINSNGNVVDQLVTLFLERDDLTIKLLSEVENQLS